MKRPFRPPQIYYMGRDNDYKEIMVVCEEPLGSIYRTDITLHQDSTLLDELEAIRAAFGSLIKLVREDTPNGEEGGEFDPKRYAPI